MNAARIPAGTKAAIVKAVLAEKYPKQALGAIAARYSITYAELRTIIDAAGYPNEAKMAKAAEALKLEEQAELDTPVDDLAATANDKNPAAADAGDGNGYLTRLSPTQLFADPNNPRDDIHLDDPDIIELADSMTEVGLLQPIVARRDKDRLVVVAGHRRLMAARRLRWSHVDVIVRGPMPSDQVLAAMLIENGQRKDLDPIQEARGLRALKTAHGLSDAETGAKVGRNQVFVSNRLALLSLPAEDQAAIRRGDMTLVEGVHRGRLASGKVRAAGQDKGWHLGPAHELAQHAKARCQRLGHKTGRKVGGMACGECWESVIRADARQDFVDVAEKTGTCPVCDNPVEKHDHQLEEVGA